MMAATAVVLTGLLPVAHLHADDDHPIVHQHVIADGSGHPDDHAGDHASGHAGDHDASAGPPDHTTARMLMVSFDLTTSVMAVQLPVVTCRFVEPAIAPPAPIGRTRWWPTHDPPLRFVSSPAPPARI